MLNLLTALSLLLLVLTLLLWTDYSVVPGRWWFMTRSGRYYDGGRSDRHLWLRSCQPGASASLLAPHGSHGTWPPYFLWTGYFPGVQKKSREWAGAYLFHGTALMVVQQPDESATADHYWRDWHTAGHRPTVPFWLVRIPFWMLAVTTGMLPGIRLAVAANHLWRERRVRSIGLCPGCGYDLRATPEQCPECGRMVQPPANA